VVSIHSPAFPLAPALLRGRDLTAIKLTLSQDVWLLDVVFHFLRRRLPSPLLVGGDFNYSRLLDDPTPRGNAEFFDRIATEGFTNLHRLFHVGDEQTYFNLRHPGHQLDYLYADASTAGRATACDVVKHDRVASFSDHAPVLAELTIA
jgi:endonuclease/exonuclease/phosphatase family metal-dependent hydrolase